MADDPVPSGQTAFVSEGYFHQLLQKAVAAGASDVHLKVGQPPGARVGGSLVFFRVDRLRPNDTEAAARHVLRRHPSPVELDELKEFDLPYEVRGIGRFRVNVYRQRSSLAYSSATFCAVDASGGSAMRSAVRSRSTVSIVDPA